MKRLIGILLLLLVLLATVPAVLAGGWAAVVLDELPGEIHAGETQTVGFMVLQHGKTPVHNLGGDAWPVEPIVEASNAATGETLRVEAVPTEEVGHFVAEMIFPSEGEWAWSITPMPFNTSKQEFEPLTVLPTPEPAGMLAQLSGQAEALAVAGGATFGLLRWVALGLMGAGVALFAWQRRRHALSVRADA